MAGIFLEMGIVTASAILVKSKLVNQEMSCIKLFPFYRNINLFFYILGIFLHFRLGTGAFFLDLSTKINKEFMLNGIDNYICIHLEEKDVEYSKLDQDDEQKYKLRRTDYRKCRAAATAEDTNNGTAANIMVAYLLKRAGSLPPNYMEQRGNENAEAIKCNRKMKSN